MTNSLQRNIPEIIQEDTYLRERFAPKPGDLGFYLHLSDLRLALESVATDENLLVLDYGSGGSPYQLLFPKSTYRRADFGGMTDLDYTINESGVISERDGIFDLILSTQVAEHVKTPSNFFAECFRLLKPGGTLVLTTHGSFEDHGCPYDYQRWTAHGLIRDLEAAGFVVESMAKLTTGPRAVLFLVERGWLQTKKPSILGTIFLGIRGVLKLFRPLFHRLCDHELREHRIVTDDLDSHTLYIALFAVTRKPSV